MDPQIQLGVSYDGSDPPDALLSLAKAADAAGAADIWLASHLFLREPIACAAMTLSATEQMGIVLMAMSPYTVHPVYATMAAATLDEFFPGRVQLCFGMGSPRELEAAGVAAEQPLRTLRETLELSRQLLSGDTIDYQGQRFRISRRRLAMGARSVPLWLAASGPQMLQLAGEKADGIVISAGTSPAFIHWALGQVRRGEELAGREIKKAALVLCSVGDDARIANDRLRRRLGYVLRGEHHARNLELAGSRLDQAALSLAFAQEDWSGFDALITDDVVQRHCASGTPSQVLAMVAAYRAAGLDEIVAYGMHGCEQTEDVLTVVSRRSTPALNTTIRSQSGAFQG
jgi:5,10-methylenetetrahydromethanopterin reductase